MEIVRIGTDNTIGKREIQDVVRDLQDMVGGFFEIVRPQGMRTTDYVMIVNESGLMRGLPENRAGSSLYRHTIVGDIVIMPERFTSSGPDLVGFRPGEAETVIKAFLTQAPYLRRDDVAQERRTEGKSEAGPEKEEHKAFLVAEHPRRSETGFHFTKMPPMECMHREETLIPGYVILHDGMGPGKDRNVTNMFGTMVSSSFDVYGDCVLAGIDGVNGNPRPLGLKETGEFMERFGFPKSAWFAPGMLRGFSQPVPDDQTVLDIHIYQKYSITGPRNDLVFVSEGEDGKPGKDFTAHLDGRTYIGRILDGEGHVMMAETPWLGSSEPIRGNSGWEKGKIDMNDVVVMDDGFRKSQPAVFAVASDAIGQARPKLTKALRDGRDTGLSR